MLNEANFMFYSIKLSVRSPLLSLLCQCNILGCITNKIFEKKLFLTHLRVCPREHQAVALHAISPISMKVCQFKGSTLKLKQATWFLFWLFPWVNTPPLRFFLVFPMEVASKQEKCMSLSMRWYLTYYSEGFHTYCYILNKCTTQVSVNLIEGLSSSALSQLTKCVVVLKMRYGQQGALLL